MLRIMTTHIDLLGCKHDALTDKEACKQFLMFLVEQLGMRIIPEELIGSNNPVSFFFKADDTKAIDEGVTGTVTLYESHAAFHAWPNRGKYVCVVISSCKYYDALDIGRIVAEYLNAKIYHVKEAK